MSDQQKALIGIGMLAASTKGNLNPETLVEAIYIILKTLKD